MADSPPRAGGLPELAFAPALELAALVRDRAVSPVELVACFLERIERLDADLGAFVTVDAERALAAARLAESRPPAAPFHGVPLAVKDLTETAGLRTTFSCRGLADYVPDRDAAVVRRLREAGFVVLGKTNTCELGTLPTTESVLNGPCRSPWDAGANAGGSSGGSAAAVAAGLTPTALGSDGGGSIRIPASCCGAVGLKPARGRVSPAPYAGLEGLATTGPLARTVADAAALLDAIAGYEPADDCWAPPPARPFLAEVERDPARLRVGVTATPPVDVVVENAPLAALRETARLASELGHDVDEIEPDWRDGGLVADFLRVWQVSASLAGVDEAALEPLNRALAARARATSSAEYAWARIRLHAFARRLVSSLDAVDVLLAPVLARPSVPVGWLTGEGDDVDEAVRRSWQLTPFTCAANIAGLPALSLPVAWPGGRPVGVQLVGRPAGEATVIALAAQLERAAPWRDRRPPGY